MRRWHLTVFWVFFFFAALSFYRVFSFCKFPWQHPDPLPSCLCRHTKKGHWNTCDAVDCGHDHTLLTGSTEPTTDSKVTIAQKQYFIVHCQRNQTTVVLQCHRVPTMKTTVTVFPLVCEEWLLPASRQSFQLVDISSSVRPNSLLA